MKTIGQIKVVMNYDGEEITLKEYFKKLLLTLWKEQEQFSDKSPFGDIGWEFDIYTAMIKEGLVFGTLDENGYIEQLDTSEADALILKYIKNDLFKG